jgi:hypothetical protein
LERINLYFTKTYYNLKEGKKNPGFKKKSEKVMSYLLLIMFKMTLFTESSPVIYANCLFGNISESPCYEQILEAALFQYKMKFGPLPKVFFAKLRRGQYLIFVFKEHHFFAKFLWESECATLFSTL